MGFNDINLQVSGPQQPASTYKTKVLKGQVPFATQVTEPNTKYVIKHDFELDADVTIPENCILEFDGGSISGNYTINMNYQPINANKKDYIFRNKKVDNLVVVYADWFGVNENNENNSFYLQNACNCSFDNINTVRLIHFNSGIYNFSDSINIGNCTLIGEETAYFVYNNKSKTVLRYNGNDDFIIVNYQYNNIQNKNTTFYIKNIAFITNQGEVQYNVDYNAKAAIKIDKCTKIQGENIIITGFYTGIEINSGILDTSISNIRIDYCHYAILFDNKNNVNTTCYFYNCYFHQNYIDVNIKTIFTNINFINCIFESSYEKAILITPLCRSLNLIGCYSENSCFKVTSGNCYIIEQINTDDEGTVIQPTVPPIISVSDFLFVGNTTSQKRNFAYMTRGILHAQNISANKLNHLCFINDTDATDINKVNIQALSVLCEQSLINPSSEVSNISNTRRFIINSGYALLPKNTTICGGNNGNLDIEAGEKDVSYARSAAHIKIPNAELDINEDNIISIGSPRRMGNKFDEDTKKGIKDAISFPANDSKGYLDIASIDSNQIFLSAHKNTDFPYMAISIPTNPNVGVSAFTDRVLQHITYGSNRPTLPNIWSMRGFCYFDATLGKPIWWNGSEWVDATGATV